MIATLLFLPWTLLVSMLVMHMPMFVIFHALWTWVCLLVLAVTFIGSAGRALLRRVRG